MLVSYILLLFYYDLISLWTFTFSIAELLASSVRRLRSWKAQRDHPQRAKRSKKGCWFGMGCQIWPWVSVTRRQTAKKPTRHPSSHHMGFLLIKLPSCSLDYTGPLYKVVFYWGVPVRMLGSDGIRRVLKKSTWPCQAPNFWRLIQQI